MFTRDSSRATDFTIRLLEQAISEASGNVLNVIGSTCMHTVQWSYLRPFTDEPLPKTDNTWRVHFSSFLSWRSRYFHAWRGGQW